MIDPHLNGGGGVVLPDLSFTRFHLRNGMTLVVHEDRTAPVVALALWYRVGSGHEPVGRQGFAHLFEHLMFAGSEHHRRGYFEAFSHVGAMDLNGTTWVDRTNYFVTVPKEALDLALWMESDRMGHLLGAVGQHELDVQRGVVANEKLENEGRPYGLMGEVMQRHAYPPGHPYGHTTIGSMEDLADSSLDDVRHWFAEHYGAANATLALAGDIGPLEALARVERHFAEVAPGPARRHPAPWVARRPARRLEIYDSAPFALVRRQWSTPPWGDADIPLLELAAAVLGGSAAARLHRRLVRDTSVAIDASAHLQPLAVCSPFMISARLRSEADIERAEHLLDEEVQRLIVDGPTPEELESVQSALVADFFRATERVGGMEGKAAMLAEGQALRDDPAAHRHDVAAMFAARPADVQQAVRRWLADSAFTLIVRPGTRAADNTVHAADSGDDWPPRPPVTVAAAEVAPNWLVSPPTFDRRSGPPTVRPLPTMAFPPIETTRLACGLEIVLARRRRAPLAHAILQLPGGSAIDLADRGGVARFATAVMNEGTLQDDAQALLHRQHRMGSSVSAGAGPQASVIECNVINNHLEDGLALMMEMALQPRFAEEGLDLVRQRSLASLRQMLADPPRLADLLLPTLLYGESHPFGRPGNGLGTVPTLESLSRADLVDFHRRQFVPRDAKLLVCGDIEIGRLAQRLEAAFAGCGNLGTGSLETALAAHDVANDRIFVLDMPGAGQSAILGGVLVPSGVDPAALRMVNAVLGGSFQSRLNMNLREDKHWAYGAHSSWSECGARGAFTVSVSVQADRTIDALLEMRAEVNSIGSTRPPTLSEFARVTSQAKNTFAGRYETAHAVAAALSFAVLNGRTPKSVVGELAGLEALTAAALQAAAENVFRNRPMTWIVAGDAADFADRIVDATGVVPRTLDATTILVRP